MRPHHTQIVPTRIAHARTRPRRNAFHYRLCYFAIPLGQWAKGHSLLSFDRFNLFSLYGKDYGDGTASPEAWLKGILAAHDLKEADGEIVLLTLPRLFGYAFNPVSFWFCLDRQGAPRAVLAEVNNTFGERHCYLCRRDDHGPIVKGAALGVRKVFHVSPFMEVKGDYRFRFAFEDNRIAVQIDLLDEDGVALATSMSGRPQKLSAFGLLKAALAYPLQTIKVVALIHYQAVKLYGKGVRPYRKPAPPESFVSH